MALVGGDAARKGFLSKRVVRIVEEAFGTYCKG